jgi:hypothetical protein
VHVEYMVERWCTKLAEVDTNQLLRTSRFNLPLAALT